MRHRVILFVYFPTGTSGGARVAFPSPSFLVRIAAIPTTVIIIDIVINTPHPRPPFLDSIVTVAEGGDLEVLIWARTKGCPWDADTCYRAVQYGHLELLKWARANECPWDARIQYAALFGEYAEVNQWARANGCPWKDDL